MVITVIVKGYRQAKICRSLLEKQLQWEKGDNLPGIQALPVYFFQLYWLV